MRYLQTRGLLIAILIFTAHASSTSIDQTTLTNEDRRAIMSLLFEKEISAAKEKEVVLLLSPRTNENWPLGLPGIRFRKLDWGEEKAVFEYYELDERKIHRDYIEIWLSKGNYCNKSGASYQFRKERGKWTVKPHGSFDSYGGSGAKRPRS